MYTVFFEKVSMALSMRVSFSSSSNLCLADAIVRFEIGLFSSIVLMSFFV